MTETEFGLMFIQARDFLLQWKVYVPCAVVFYVIFVFVAGDWSYKDLWKTYSRDDNRMQKEFNETMSFIFFIGIAVAPFWIFALLIIPIVLIGLIGYKIQLLIKTIIVRQNTKQKTY